jgi:hypothetical protein
LADVRLVKALVTYPQKPVFLRQLSLIPSKTHLNEVLPHHFHEAVHAKQILEMNEFYIMKLEKVVKLAECHLHNYNSTLNLFYLVQLLNDALKTTTSANGLQKAVHN